MSFDKSIHLRFDRLNFAFRWNGASRAIFCKPPLDLRYPLGKLKKKETLTET